MNHREIWEKYVAAWKVESSQQKLALFEQCLAENCVYHDPITKTMGWQALVDYMLDFQAKMPGGHFVTKTFLTHGNKSIATWEMHDQGNTVLGIGYSYGEYNGDNKLVEMTGFYELPSE